MSVVEAPAQAPAADPKPRSRHAGGRPCHTCNHPQRANIEAAVLAGRSVLSTAADYHLDRSGVARHMKLHAKRDISTAVANRNGLAGTTLLARIQESHAELKAILIAAKDTHELTVAVNAVQGGLRALELEGRLTGEISSGGVSINVALGVSVDSAKRSVETVASAQAMPQGEVAERAVRCLERMSLSADQLERLQRRVERGERESIAEVIE